MFKYIIKNRFEIGLVISFFATQFARVIIEWFKLDTNISNTVFIIGLLIVTNYTNLFSVRFPKLTRPMIALLLYQIIVIIAAIVANKTSKHGVFDISYTYFCAVFILFISTNDTEKFNGEAFVEVGWWSTGICSVIISYLATRGYKYFGTISQLSQGSDRLTLSVIAFGFLIFALVYNRNTLLKRIVSYVFIAAAVITVIVCSRKGLLISYAVIMALHFIKNGSTVLGKWWILKLIVLALIMIAAYVVVASLNNELTKSANAFWDNLSSAIRGFLGQETGRESSMYNSGTIRNNSYESMWNEFRSFTNNELLFGRGYAYKQTDFPFFEAFYDLGLFMGIYYAIIQFFIPVRLILKKTEDRGIMFIQYYAIVVIVQNFYSGVPYGYYKFIPIAVLFLFLTEKKKHMGVIKTIKALRR